MNRLYSNRGNPGLSGGQLKRMARLTARCVNVEHLD
jgi:hypothetical protein